MSKDLREKKVLFLFFPFAFSFQPTTTKNKIVLINSDRDSIRKEGRTNDKKIDNSLAVRLAAALSWLCVGVVEGLAVCLLEGAPYWDVRETSFDGETYVQDVASPPTLPVLFPVVVCWDEYGGEYPRKLGLPPKGCEKAGKAWWVTAVEDLLFP